MSNSNIFCNVPWSNTHIYWDGSYGMCCSETHNPYANNKNNNIKNMSVVQWYNSDEMKGVRKQMRGDTPIPQCAACYKEESHGFESRRIRENYKSAIFTEQAFNKSYQQSPWYDKFESDSDHTPPIDWHVDLGNECNLSCKMCNPRASSQIASQYKKWNIYSGNIQNNWTQDQESWDRFVNDISNIDNLNRIHFMGGEPTMSKRFVELLRTLIAHGKTHLSLSFVSNGTRVNEEILNLLSNFRSVDIEISIESIHDNNHYIRQGSVTSDVLRNIEYLNSLQGDKFHLVIRPVPQLLNVNNYDELIMWAYERKLALQSIPLVNPPHYQISVLPPHIKEGLLPKYKKLLAFFQVEDSEPVGIATGRNVGILARQMARECTTIISMLESDEPSNVEELRNDLIFHAKRWDAVHGYDALEFYPEYREFFIKYGY